jgi:hypothetical protein
MWVNRVILVVGRLLPVFPWKRTSPRPAASLKGANNRSGGYPEVGEPILSSWTPP